MSGTENEAVRSEAIEAGGRAIGEAAAASNYEADWPDMAAAAYDAMRPIIARDERLVVAGEVLDLASRQDQGLFRSGMHWAGTWVKQQAGRAAEDITGEPK
jgi:hypothetical protein